MVVFTMKLSDERDHVVCVMIKFWTFASIAKTKTAFGINIFIAKRALWENVLFKKQIFFKNIL